MRTALFWVITQRVMIIPYRRFGKEKSIRTVFTQSTFIWGGYSTSRLENSNQEKLLGLLTLVDGTDKLSRNVGKDLPLLAA